MRYTIVARIDDDFEFPIGEVDVGKDELQNIKDAIHGASIVYGGWEVLSEIL